MKDILYDATGSDIDSIIKELHGFKNFNADDPRIRTLLTEVIS